MTRSRTFVVLKCLNFLLVDDLFIASQGGFCYVEVVSYENGKCGSLMSKHVARKPSDIMTLAVDLCIDSYQITCW